MDTEMLLPRADAPDGARTHVIEPVVRRLPPELTPLRALAAVEQAPHTLFLESGGQDGEGARWTLLAFDPLWRLEARAGRLWQIERNSSAAIPGEPLRALAQAWPERAALSDGIGLPFVSGLAGYLSYDLKDLIERYPQRAKRESACADLSLGFYDVVWTWDRWSGRGWVVATGLPEVDPHRREERARTRLWAQWARIVDGAPQMRMDFGSGVAGDSGAAHTGSVAGSGSVAGAGADSGAWVPASGVGSTERAGAVSRVTSNFTRDGYRRVVESALEHIAAGDIYQVNLAQRFRVEAAPAPAVLFRRLREESPAPFSAFLSFLGGGIVSSSPERFFRVQGSRIETWPIKGTRPRGATPEEDAALRAALLASEKDRAENVMIVDLERNDLGRVCEIGSVGVPALWDVASYANVHHLVSRVEGRLRPDAGPVDVIRALFPGGSITGAPKIRAVEIIDELEPVRRGVYTGAIGYWDVRGDCDWNIAIRTLVLESGAASFHVGGGIVADSTPEGEYEETLVKASAMLRALDARSEGQGAAGSRALSGPST